jgi:NAD-dependent deacetylase
MNELIEHAARDIVAADMTVALTGAGVSTESGIPDFRSKNGLWSRYDIREYGTIDAFHRNPGKVWRMLREMLSLLDAEPNPAHRALARLEEMGYLDAIVTQNVDNLHQEAGSQTVVEFHGNFTRVVCVRCGNQRAAEQVSLEEMPPRCTCGGVLKPDGVFFGEQIPPEAYRRAMALAQRCDLLLVVGTSATVSPANHLPYLVKAGDGTVIEVNTEATELTGGLSDYLIRGKAGEVLPCLVDAVTSASQP